MGVKYSIVMVTYNHEKYIAKAIESVLKQNTKEQIEILVGDDGSNDRTVEILNSYKNKYAFIDVFAHNNVGLSKNVYDLLMKAKGEYIAILEGDDYWIDNDKLVKQRKIIEDNRCIATACNSLKIDENGKTLGLWNDRKSSKILSNKEVLKYQTSLWHPSALMFRNIFLNSGDKYKVIAEASRMGGNHSGLINLMADEGKIFLDITPMTIWLSVNKTGGMNYSSQKLDSLHDYYESMNKYEYYNRVFKMNYERNVYSCYRLCVRKLRNELIENIGFKSYLRIKYSYIFFAIIRKIKKLIKRGIKI